MYIKNYKVHGLVLQIRTDEDQFADLVDQYYSVFRVGYVNNINITVYFSHTIPWSEKTIAIENKRFGEGVYVGENELYWKNEFGFHCCLKIIDRKQWALQGFHDDLLYNYNSAEILKNMIRSMRWLVHFPVFEMLNRNKGIGVMHASAVSSEKETLVFAGLNKVGKSTLARYFYEKYGYQYLSDNFLLHDEKKVYAFPEKVRLSKEAIKYYGISDQKDSFVYGKKQLNVPNDRILQNSCLQKIFFINNGKTIKINSISHTEFKNMISSAHRYLKEFSEYEFLSFLDLYNKNIGNRQNCDIDSSCLFYELTLPLNWDLKKVVENIYKCL